MSDDRPNPSAALAVAERQLEMLGELGEMAMAVSRAFASSALASARAEERILADEYFMPEVGRAGACGAKNAAESFQKVSRAVRLTLKLELAVAEVVDALREGRSLPGKNAGETPAVQLAPEDFDRLSLSPTSSRDLAGSCVDAEARDRDDRDRETEGLLECDQPDRLPRGTFREVVDGLCADLEVTPDWSGWSVEAGEIEARPRQPTPPGWSECRPPRSEEYPRPPLPESVTPPQTPP